MVRVSEILTVTCGQCGGESEIRVLVGTLGQTMRTQRCRTSNCPEAKPRTATVARPFTLIA